MLEEPVWRVEKVPGDEEMLRVAIADLLNALTVEVEEDRTGVAEKNGRVSRDEKLRMPRRNSCG